MEQGRATHQGQISLKREQMKKIWSRKGEEWNAWKFQGKMKEDKWKENLELFLVMY